MNHTSTIGWAPGPQGRGTIGLVYSCLMTMFLCSWSAVHPNLPAMDESAWQILRRRIWDMMLAVVMPERIVMFALLQLRDAREVRKKSPRWTLQQSFFLMMGGYVVQTSPRGGPVRFRPAVLVDLFDNGALAWPPAIDDEITDRIKSDSLAKFLALLQALWFATQVAARASARLPVSTLELFTLGIVVCAAFTYGAWWAKPFNVQRPVVLYMHGSRNTDTVAVANTNSNSAKKDTASLLAHAYHQRRISIVNDDGIESDLSFPFLLLPIILLVFGTIHLLGWSFFFCSPAEKWLWRVGSVMCTSLPIATFGLGILFSWVRDEGGVIVPEWASWLIISSGILLYVCSRVMLLVLVFIGLREVPEGVYQTIKWTNYLPAFG